MSSSPLFINEKEFGLHLPVLSGVLLLRGFSVWPFGWGRGFYIGDSRRNSRSIELSIHVQRYVLGVTH